jgi:hypothetical protein
LDKGTAQLGEDVPLFYYPWRYFAKATLLSGHLPLWKPYSFGGSPYIASFEGELFYPDFLLWLLLPLKTAFVLNYLVHFYLGAAGMYLLVHRYTRNGSASFLAALSFAFGGFLISKISGGHIPVIQAAVGLPWILLCAEKVLENKRFSLWAFATGLLYAVNILTGFPEISFMIGLVLTLRFAWEIVPKIRASDRAQLTAPLANFVVILLVTVGVTAVQLLPALEMIGLSARVDSSYEVIRRNSWPFINIATLLTPDILGSAALNNAVQGALSVEAACYTGLIALYFALFAWYLKPHRLAAFYTTVVVLSLFLATGGYNPLYRLVYALPGFKQVAAPPRYVYLLAFAVPVLAGLTMHALTELIADRKKISRLAVFVFAVAAGAGVASLLFFVFREQILALGQRVILARYPDPERQLGKLLGLYATQLTGLTAFTVLTLLTGLLLIYRLRAPQGRALFSGLALSLLVADLFFFNYKYLPTADTLRGEPVESYHAFLAKDDGLYRVLPLAGANRYPESGLITGTASIVGYSSIVFRDYRAYLAALEGVSVEKLEARAPMLKNHRSPLVDHLNVKYVVSKKAIDDPALRLVRDGEYKIYQKKRFAPRAYVAHRAETIPDGQKALARLRQTAYGGRAILEKDAGPIRPLPAGVSAPVPEVVRDGPNALTVRANALADGLLVVSEVNYPGWKAFVDGREAPILRTNYLFQGVLLPRGRHTVRLVYAPPSLRAGALISGVTVLAMLLVCLIHVRKRGRPGADTPTGA